MSNRYALIGAAGYVAPKHMEAIRNTKGELIAAFDKSDSVGVLDNYFPYCSFFTEFERFDRFLEKERRKENGIDYLSVCTPNYLHDAHCRLGLKAGANVICEKPLVLNPWNIDALEKVERECGKKIYNILQLRLHPSIIKLKKEVDVSAQNQIFDVDLSYFTLRGKWYHISWKGDESKSGGIATNIGIHFFDALTWTFGNVKKSIVHHRTADFIAGYMELSKARVRWVLSINEEYFPRSTNGQSFNTYRSMIVNNEEIEFSAGFEDLHTKSYQEILDGNGFGIDQVRTSIHTVHEIRNIHPAGLKGDYHPLAKKFVQK